MCRNSRKRGADGRGGEWASGQGREYLAHKVVRRSEIINAEMKGKQCFFLFQKFSIAEFPDIWVARCSAGATVGVLICR